MKRVLLFSFMLLLAFGLSGVVSAQTDNADLGFDEDDVSVQEVDAGVINGLDRFFDNFGEPLRTAEERQAEIDKLLDEGKTIEEVRFLIQARDERIEKARLRIQSEDSDLRRIVEYRLRLARISGQDADDLDDSLESIENRKISELARERRISELRIRERIDGWKKEVRSELRRTDSGYVFRARYYETYQFDGTNAELRAKVIEDVRSAFIEQARITLGDSDAIRLAPGDFATDDCIAGDPTSCPQCRNGVDDADPEDILVDANDPGCWIDPTNPDTYNSGDNDETNGFVPGSVCGNGNVEEDEVCDDGVNNGEIGFCKIDCSGPYVPECGNSVVEGDEQCDSGNLNGETCVSNGYASGTLVCNSECMFDFSQCVSNIECGNGILEGEEQCDDGNNDNNDACLNTCRNNVCGDGIMLESIEECDDGNTNNSDLCTNTCTLTFCGDGIRNGNEVCDSESGETQECSVGGYSGTAVCNSECSGFVCTPSETCGDGIINGPEVCDGSVVGGETCEANGYDGGSVGCTESCLDYDYSSCISDSPQCSDTIDNDGDGLIDVDDPGCYDSEGVYNPEDNSENNIIVGECPEGKALVCHIPSGHPEAAKTLCVGIPASEHGHAPGSHGGDYLGRCANDPGVGEDDESDGEFSREGLNVEVRRRGDSVKVSAVLIAKSEGLDTLIQKVKDLLSFRSISQAIHLRVADDVSDDDSGSGDDDGDDDDSNDDDDGDDDDDSDDDDDTASLSPGRRDSSGSG